MRTIVILLLTLAVTIKSHADALDTWTNVATSAYGDFHQIAFGNGTFMAVSEHGFPGPFVTGTSTSIDGLHWTTSGTSYNPPNNEILIDGVAFGNGTFVRSVSFGDGGAAYWNSGTNGSNVTGLTQLNCVAFGNGIFVAAGFDYEGGDFGAAYVSTNGQTWPAGIHDTIIASGFNPLSIAYGNGGFVATGYSNYNNTNELMFYSEDGITWFDETPYIGFSFIGISFVNGLFTTLGPNGTYYTSPNPDIYNFTAAGSINPNLYVPTSGTNHLYVSVGTNGGVYTSPDRVHWTQRTTGITNNLTCIAYGDNRFVAAGAAGGIFVSSSTAPVLSAQSQSSAGIQLTLAGGLGPTYHIQASSDLSNWTNLVAFTNIGTGTNYLDTTASNFTQRYYRTISP